MSYCTKEDILGEISMSDLVALTDDTNLNTLNLTVLNQLIANASSLIDSRLANIYTVPFGTPPPSAIKSAAVTITCYRLFRRRLTPDEKNLFFDDYENVMRFLDKVNAGEAQIDSTVSRAVPPGVNIQRPTIYAAGVTGSVLNSM